MSICSLSLRRYITTYSRSPYSYQYLPRAALSLTRSITQSPIAIQKRSILPSLLSLRRKHTYTYTHIHQRGCRYHSHAYTRQNSKTTGNTTKGTFEWMNVCYVHISLVISRSLFRVWTTNKLTSPYIHTYINNTIGLVVGCGSNVVDKFYRVVAIPKRGEKGYFKDNIEDCKLLVGGVTLNHLSWYVHLYMYVCMCVDVCKYVYM